MVVISLTFKNVKRLVYNDNTLTFGKPRCEFTKRTRPLRGIVNGIIRA
jgi:hypothetical protein